MLSDLYSVKMTLFSENAWNMIDIKFSCSEWKSYSLNRWNIYVNPFEIIIWLLANVLLLIRAIINKRILYNIKIPILHKINSNIT